METSRLIDGYQHFQRTCCLHFQIRKKMEAAGYSEPLIPTYYDTLRHIAKRTSTLYSCEWVSEE